MNPIEKHKMPNQALLSGREERRRPYGHIGCATQLGVPILNLIPISLVILGTVILSNSVIPGTPYLIIDSF